MIKDLFLPLALVALFIVFVGLLTQGKLTFLTGEQSQNKTSETQKTITINGKVLNVEVAETPEERSKGLGGRDALGENSAMIFVFPPKSSGVNFWMKDTKIPLDIIWISDGKVKGITKDVEPEPGVSDSKLTLYPAPTAIDYVVEVNAGWSEKNGIKVGDSVNLEKI